MNNEATDEKTCSALPDQSHEIAQQETCNPA